MQGLLKKFEYAEVIFGCEDIVDNNVAAIMAVEGKMVELITKNKSANLMARLMKEDKLKLYVSRDCKWQVLSGKKWKLFSSTFWQIKSSTFLYSTRGIIRGIFLLKWQFFVW